MEQSQNVTIIEEPGRTIYLVGTAHVSRQSVDEVRRVIALVKPDVVCVELDTLRYQALTDESRWRQLDIFKVFRERKTLFLFANLALGAFQRRLGRELGVRPGEELLAGAEAAKEVGARLELVDRDIQITLRRTWRLVGWWQRIQLMGVMLESFIAKPEIDAKKIEELKETENLADMMTELTAALPRVTRPLIDERDSYMSSLIAEAGGSKLVAVVGAAHVPGMKRMLTEKTPVDRDALLVIPPRSRWVTVMQWVIPVLIVAAFFYGIRQSSGHSWQELVYAWILPCSLLASLGVVVGGGKPLSVLAAFVSSPIAALNPLIGTAMLVGPIEAWLRKPTVADCERINEDVQTMRGVYKNPFTRTLLVALLSGFGTAAGGWIGTVWVIKILTT